ncbi:hypothetical protein BC833DRAFT_641463 [Globomyces pollinis-pini]|nr:hypothetical protein BC833DRAFT_641463 [Globomyces pollinis-pini]
MQMEVVAFNVLVQHLIYYEMKSRKSISNVDSKKCQMKEKDMSVTSSSAVGLACSVQYWPSMGAFDKRVNNPKNDVEQEIVAKTYKHKAWYHILKNGVSHQTELSPMKKLIWLLAEEMGFNNISFESASSNENGFEDLGMRQSVELIDKNIQVFAAKADSMNISEFYTGNGVATLNRGSLTLEGYTSQQGFSFEDTILWVVIIGGIIGLFSTMVCAVVMRILILLLLVRTLLEGGLIKMKGEPERF